MRFSNWVTRNLLYPGALAATGQGSLGRRLAELSRDQWEPAERLAPHRHARLREVLAAAIDGVPFYRGVFPDLSGDAVRRMPAEELMGLHRSFPRVSKRRLQTAPRAFTAPPPPGRVGRKTTGGSTGEPVTLLKPAGAMAQERAAMWLAYGWFGVAPGDRCLRFWGISRDRRRRLRARLADAAMNRTTLSAFAFLEEDLRRYWAELARTAPDYLHGYVSLVDEFVRLGLDEELVPPEVRLKSVILTAEAITHTQRRRVERTFGVSPQIEYGCGEVGPIAHECLAGNLHLHWMNLEVEILDEAGDPAPEGRVVVTDLHNLAMPLIRYDLGDFAAWGESCDCGRTMPVLDNVYGRAYHMVRDVDGQRFHGEYFMYLFEELRERGSSISQFQVAQSTIDSLDVRIVCRDGDWRMERDRTRRAFREALPQFEVSVARVPTIERLPSGKMQVIDNRVTADA